MSGRDVYRALSVWYLVKAAFRGPAALCRFMLRRSAHRSLARTMRRSGL